MQTSGGVCSWLGPCGAKRGLPPPCTEAGDGPPSSRQVSPAGALGGRMRSGLVQGEAAGQGAGVCPAASQHRAADRSPRSLRQASSQTSDCALFKGTKPLPSGAPFTPPNPCVYDTPSSPAHWTGPSPREPPETGMGLRGAAFRPRQSLEPAGRGGS